MTADDLRAWIDEVAGDLEGSVVRRVTQPEPDRIVLRLRRPGENVDLLIVAAPRFSRIVLTEEPGRPPKEAPSFCMTLRKHLGGARLHALRQPEGDRVAELTFTHGPEPSEALRLVAEFFGRGANLALLDADDRLLAVLHPHGGGARPMLPGKPYPPRPAARPAQSGADDTPRADDTSPAADPSDEPRPFNAGLDRRLREAEEAHRLEERRTSVRRALRRERKKLERRREKVERERDGLAPKEESLRLGELLKAHLGPLGGPDRRGLAEAELTDWTTEGTPTVRVELDPKKTLLENMERHFQRARKADRAVERIRSHLAWTERQLAELEELDRRARGATTTGELEPVRSALDERAGRERARSAANRRHSGGSRRSGGPGGPGGSRGGAGTPTAGPRRFESADGIELLVGRNARGNDALTFRLARGNDWWFHVEDRPGSHVVARVPKDRPLPSETLLDAACLAVHFSEARDHTSATVQYTRRKNIRKPKGAPPGLVWIAERKTVFLRPDPARLDRLLGRSDPFGGESSSTPPA